VKIKNEIILILFCATFSLVLILFFKYKLHIKANTLAIVMATLAAAFISGIVVLEGVKITLKNQKAKEEKIKRRNDFARIIKLGDCLLKAHEKTSEISDEIKYNVKNMIQSIKNDQNRTNFIKENMKKLNGIKKIIESNKISNMIFAMEVDKKVYKEVEIYFQEIEKIFKKANANSKKIIESFSRKQKNGNSKQIGNAPLNEELTQELEKFIKTTVESLEEILQQYENLKDFLKNQLPKD